MFQGSLKVVSRKFQWCFEEVSRAFQRSYMDVSRVFHDFQGCFHSVLRKFQEKFQGVLKSFMALIAASRAEGGLVFYKTFHVDLIWGVGKCLEAPTMSIFGLIMAKI